MEDNDQIIQFNEIAESYRQDLNVLGDILASWQQSGADPDKLDAAIKAGIKNAGSITVSTDDNGSYLVDFKFQPIEVQWILKTIIEEH